jgi:hypothetical protein
MHVHRVVLAVAALVAAGAPAQESYKVEVLKEAPPEALAGAVRGTLAAPGYRVVDGQGKSYAEVWLRKSIPASGKPAGPKGAVQFPVLAEGELLGALRFPGEGHDYRDQSIPQGVYTLRYGLQPVNGDHLGVSTYRDYALLLPAGRDKTLDNLAQKKLQDQSADAAGTSHPAVLMLLAASPDAAKAEPSMAHDEEKNTWAAVIPLSLAVKGEAAPVALPIQLVVVGAANP